MGSGDSRMPPFYGLEDLESRLFLSSAPVFQTPLEDIYLGNVLVPLSVPIHGADDDLDILAITASSDDSELTVSVPQNNRLARLNFVDVDDNGQESPVGEILIELFDSHFPVNTQRFVELATLGFDESGNVIAGADPYYTDIPVHRVSPNFVIQMGDGDGVADGRGESPLGSFNATVDPSVANFISPGLLAFANMSGNPNTSDNQFFITTDLEDPGIQALSNSLIGSIPVDLQDDLVDGPLSQPVTDALGSINVSASAAVTVTVEVPGQRWRLNIPTSPTFPDEYGVILKEGESLNVYDPGYAIIGQMVAGQDVFEGILTRELLPGLDQPLDVPNLRDIEILDDGQSGTMTLEVTEEFDGRAMVAVMLDDGNGNLTEQSINVLRVGNAPTISSLSSGLELSPGESRAFRVEVSDDLDAGVDVSIASTSPDAITTIAPEMPGLSVTLTGNTWKAVPFDYQVTEDTVLEFDFSSTLEGETHAIGFDKDRVTPALNAFQLFGTQGNFRGNQEFFDYQSLQGNKHYKIPIGQFFTGQMNFLTFINDHDIEDPFATSTYSFIRVYDVLPGGESVDFTNLQVMAYGFEEDPDANPDPGGTAEGTSQDVEGTFVINDDTEGQYVATVTLPSEGAHDFDITLSAIEAGLEGVDRPPTELTFNVSTLGELPTISDPGTQHVTMGGLLEFEVEIIDDDDLPLDVSVSSSLQDATVAIGPATDPNMFSVMVALPPTDHQLFDVTISATESGFEDRASETRDFTVTTFGDRPVIDLPGRVFLSAGSQPTVFMAQITDDTGLPLKLGVESDSSNMLDAGIEMIAPDVYQVVLTPIDGRSLKLTEITITAAEDHELGPAGSSQTVEVISASSVIEMDSTAETLTSVTVGQVMYVANGEAGLAIYDMADVHNPVLLSSGQSPMNVRDVVVIGTTAYVADENNALVILNVTQPDFIPELSRYQTSNGVVKLLVDGGIAYTAEGKSGLVSYDVSDPFNISKLDSISELRNGEILEDARWLEKKGDIIYVADSKGGIEVINASDPSDLKHVRSVLTDVRPNGMDLSGNVLYVVNRSGRRLIAMGLGNNPRNPRQISSVGIGANTRRVTVVGQTAITANDDGFEFIDVTLRDNMFVDRAFDLGGRGGEATVMGDYISLPLWQDGQIVIIHQDRLDDLVVFDRRHRFTDDNGVQVTVGLLGTGFITAETTGDNDGSISHLRIKNSNLHTRINITTKGGDRITTIGNISIDNAVNNIYAPRVNLQGNLVVGRFLSRIVMGDVLGPSAIIIGSSNRMLNVKFGNINDLIFNASMPVGDFLADQWLNPSGEDRLDATFMGRLKIKNNFEPDMSIVGYGRIHRAKVFGDVTGTWRVDNEVNKVEIKGDATGWILESAVINRLKVRGNAINTVLDTFFMNRADFFGDLQDSLIDFTRASDPTRPDLRANNRINVKGKMINSEIRSRINLQNLRFGAMIDSDIFAGLNEDFPDVGTPQLRLPSTTADFSNLQATINKLRITGIRGDTIAFANSNIAGGTLRNIRLFGVDRDNAGVEFGVAGQFIERLILRGPSGVEPPLGSGGVGDDSVAREVVAPVPA